MKMNVSDYYDLSGLARDVDFSENVADKILCRYIKNCDEFGGWEAVFKLAQEEGNYKLFSYLYKYCPYPDYKSKYMQEAFWCTQYPDYEYDDLSSDIEDEQAARKSKSQEMILRELLNHKEALDTYKEMMIDGEYMLQHIVFNTEELVGRETYQLNHLFRIIIVLSAYGCHTSDYGPKCIGKFETDKLDEYALVVADDYFKGEWHILNEKKEIVAIFQEFHSKYVEIGQIDDYFYDAYRIKSIGKAM